MREENLNYPKIDSDEVKKKNKSVHKKLDVCGKPRTVLVTKNEVQSSFNGESNIEAETVKSLEKVNVQKEKKRRKKYKKKQLKEDHLENKGSSLELCKSRSTTSISVIKERRLFRKKLLILDINGLLADILRPAPKDHAADIKIAGRAVFRRPFYIDFLKFCFEMFDVGLWSSRSKKIMDGIVYYLMGDMREKLLFCWDISYCTETAFKTLENRHKPLVLKELRKIWEKHDQTLPFDVGNYNETNTVLVDDSPYKALLNPPHTAIFPHSYTFHDMGDNSLGAGGELRVYLEKLAAAEDTQKYIHEHPFGQTAINDKNLSWLFYQRVICSLSSIPTR